MIKHYVNGQQISNDTSLEFLYDNYGENIKIKIRNVYNRDDFIQYANSEYFSEHQMFNIVEGLMAINRKIEAIKAVRVFTNWGMREAKEFIEINFQQ